MEKKAWHIEISQNGWEYTGWVNITACKVERLNGNTILVDDTIEMEFDEEFRLPSEQF